MTYLLDTHTLIWFATGDKRLSSSAFHIIQNLHNDVAISIATLWEIAIKVQLGKLDIDRSLEEFIHFTEQNGFRCIGITFEHVVQYVQLPLHHKDPFDRILIAQAISANMHLVGCDASFDSYPIKRIW